MREVLVLQGGSPSFRLAAWVLREEGFSVTVVTPQSGIPRALHPDVCILNADLGDEEGQGLLRLLRSLNHVCLSVHLAGDSAGTTDDCGLDACLRPPHNASTLLGAIEKR